MIYRIFTVFSVAAACIAVVACVQSPTQESSLPIPGEGSGDVAQGEMPDQPELNQEDLVTRNVTYTGILEEGGLTIYQEGSHRLMLPDGNMVLLESAQGANIPFELYTGKLVRARGDVMPTVEAGGTIMEARDVRWIRRETGDDGREHEVLRALCGGDDGARCPDGMTCVLAKDGTGMCSSDGEETVEMDEDDADKEEGVEENVEEEIADEENMEEEEVKEEEVVEDLEDAEEEVQEEEDVAEGVQDEEPEEIIVPETDNETFDQALILMIDEEYSSSRWTQEYCSTHIGFCVPVHKNWYYKSFGAMSSVISRMEMGARPVDTTGDGPIVVELKSGPLETLDIEDGAVKTVGGKVIGYRSWSDNRHFEISAPVELYEPVQFVTAGLMESE